MNFKDHFSGHANLYAQARPTYPPALFDWLASICPQRGLVWDAGCGNGQASLALAAHFDRVFATDPSDTQIAAATPRDNIRYAVEPAERCSLPDGSVDLVTVAQAIIRGVEKRQAEIYADAQTRALARTVTLAPGIYRTLFDRRVRKA